MNDELPIARSVAELRSAVAAWREAGQTVAMVPTMGALHEGHLSLVRLGRKKADRVVASIFVNPTQFAPNEDFDAYPRGEARDAAMLQKVDCDLLYAPTVPEMYPLGFSTTVKVAGVSEPMDGQARPHHFAGVATVVCKLLNQCGPDIGIFGQKDYQQLAVIRRMVRDLDLPVSILGGATMRDKDGLALSSRNAYLTPEDRRRAPTLFRALTMTAETLKGGAPVAGAEAVAIETLLAAGFGPIDYVEVRDAETLQRLGPGPATSGRLLAAAFLGKTRLIDNIGF